MIKQQQNMSCLLSREQKNRFIPFQNQRDNIGRIIRPKERYKEEFNVLQLFENLKKSTKQYFFDKNYRKMIKKFKHTKRALEPKEYNEDYEKDIKQCQQTLLQMKVRMQNQDSSQENVNQKFYVNLNDRITHQIKQLKGTICNRNNTKQEKSIKKRVNNSEKFDRLTEKQANRRNSQRINIELFRQVNPKAEMMATFCSSGLEYVKLVKNQRIDPWKKWYKTEDLQIFPDKKIQVKSLQKSLF